MSDQALALTVGEQWDNGVATVTLDGEIDLSTAALLSEVLGKIARQGPRRLAVSLAGVRFIDSTGLHTFVRIRRELPDTCPVILRSPQRQVRRVFDITGLSQVFEWEES